MRSSQGRLRSASVGCPEMGSNTLICTTNSKWTSSGFMAGRESVLSDANRMQSRKDGVYHNTMGRNLTAITKRNSCWLAITVKFCIRPR